MARKEVQCHGLAKHLPLKPSRAERCLLIRTELAGPQKAIKYDLQLRIDVVVVVAVAADGKHGEDLVELEM